jgi:curli production assembly/transport component CsgF
MMRTVGVVSLGFGLLALGSGAFASPQVYRPANPTFGGNPLNGTFLLQQAQAQGKGAKSGQQQPDLSGLNAALSNLGSSVAAPTVVIGGTAIPANP